MEKFYTPPPFKVCPDCNGGAKNQGLHGAYCECQGTGRIPIWYTVEQWEKLTGRNVSDGMPVWWFDYNWDVNSYRLLSFGESKHLRNTHFIIIATESGIPPKDWRPDET